MKKQERSLSPEIREAALILKNSGVVVFPTDTVYGIGCLWDNQKAIKRIYQIKKRNESLPLPILVSNHNQVKKIAIVSAQAKRLMAAYWPGGLTIVLKTKTGKKLGFRMPNLGSTLALIEEAGSPITGTSANFHGQTPVSDFESLDPGLTRLVDYVIKGSCPGGVESTVVDCSVNPLKIIRQGAVRI